MARVKWHCAAESSYVVLDGMDTLVIPIDTKCGAEWCCFRYPEMQCQFLHCLALKGYSQRSLHKYIPNQSFLCFYWHGIFQLQYSMQLMSEWHLEALCTSPPFILQSQPAPFFLSISVVYTTFIVSWNWPLKNSFVSPFGSSISINQWCSSR